MAEYYVDIMVKGYYAVVVEADSFDDAKEKVEALRYDMNVGNLEETESKIYYIKNKDTGKELYMLK